METDRSQWLRAQALYVQVLGLGVSTPYRGDALYSLGWIEYRLGNRMQATAHFDCFREQFPDDSRADEAHAMSVIARAEEGFVLGCRLAREMDMQAQSVAVLRFEETLSLIEKETRRVQNRGYRTVLQDVGLQCVLKALPLLEQFGEYFRSDYILGQIRRIRDFSKPDVGFCDALAEVIFNHVAESRNIPGEVRRRERAVQLLLHVNKELSQS